MDRETELINWVCSIFDNDPSHGTLNSTCGYNHFRPEPSLRLNSQDKEKTPDVIALNPIKKRVLIIEGKGGIESSLKQKFNVSEDIDKHASQLEEYKDINLSDIKKYFEGVDIPDTLELIAITYEDTYSDFEELNNKVSDLKFWIINLNDRTIKKVSGIHLDKELENISSKIPYIELANCESTPFHIYFSRKTKKEKIVSDALIKLLSYCTSNSDYELTEDKIDDILMNRLYPESNSKVPILWQFTREERMKRWRQLIGAAVQNKWMKEIRSKVYRFVKPNGDLINDSLLSSSFLSLRLQFMAYAKR